ncbi:hypothetical protein HMPREF3156_01115 [Neisseria sp. HMSC06F02]|nr:hypothetical protein HMPREF3156_01115 [Neisseria sp. HMSC06F02]
MGFCFQTTFLYPANPYPNIDETFRQPSKLSCPPIAQKFWDKSN